MYTGYFNMQLELFYLPKTQTELIQDEQELLKVSIKNLRMGLFKRQTEHAKEIAQLKAENQEIYCQLAIVMKSMAQYYEKEYQLIK